MSGREYVVFMGMLIFLFFAVAACNPGKPDLVVENITLSPANPTTIDPVQFKAVVKNNGPGISPPTEAVLRISDETDFQSLKIPALDPGASFIIRKSGTLNIARNYRVTVYADHAQDVSETNENNNIKYINFSVTKACPDLEVESLVVTPATPVVRETVKFEAAIVNIGNMVSSPTKVTIKIGNETNPEIFQLPALSPGAVITVLRSERFNKARNYSVTVYADYGNNMVECSEVNNEKFINFAVK